MDRLAGLDGAFLSFESPTIHLQILGALVFDASVARGGLDFGRIRNQVAERLHLVPPFRKRTVEVPFGLQHPVLVDDPDFNLDYHVRRVSVPSPGGLPELADLVADLASRPLDRSRPLWEFHVVEGLEGGRIAVVPKVHHSIIDGVSGAEVMAAFFDLSPDPGPRPIFGRASATRRSARVQGSDAAKETTNAPGPPPTDPWWSPAALPGEVAQWRDVVASLPAQAEGLVRTLSRTWNLIRSKRERHGTGTLGPSPFDAPSTSINRAISPHRRVAFAELPLQDVRRVRDMLGGTANDVVLAVTSGAMRTLFAGRGEQVDGSLVAMVPVSVRVDSEREALGNRLSAILVSLATGLDDPVDRLRSIVKGMQLAKEHSRTPGSEVVDGWAQAALPVVATRLSRLATNLRIFDRLAPAFNLIVSNVPGPDFPLYLAGVPMVAMYPIGPIIEGVGVNVTVFSYLDTMYAGVQACWDLVPDIETIAQGLVSSLAELVDEANRRDRPVPWWHVELPA